jgi:hypothetical protein
MMGSQSGEEEGVTRPERPLPRRDMVPAGSQAVKAVPLSLFNISTKHSAPPPPAVQCPGSGCSGHPGAPVTVPRRWRRPGAVAKGSPSP